MFKSRVLGYIESRTPALYHACNSHLSRLDHVQTRFLRDLEVDEVSALTEFNLAPLAARRDVAMLGLIHRTVLGKGPQQFSRFFKSVEFESKQNTRRATQRHSRQLQDVRDEHYLETTRRSALGLIGVYNLLPSSAFELDNVKEFQIHMQSLLKRQATAGEVDWRETFSPRLPLYSHPLTKLI